VSYVTHELLAVWLPFCRRPCCLDHYPVDQSQSIWISTPLRVSPSSLYTYGLVSLYYYRICSSGSLKLKFILMLPLPFDSDATSYLLSPVTWSSSLGAIANFYPSQSILVCNFLPHLVLKIIAPLLGSSWRDHNINLRSGQTIRTLNTSWLWRSSISNRHSGAYICLNSILWCTITWVAQWANAMHCHDKLTTVQELMTITTSPFCTLNSLWFVPSRGHLQGSWTRHCTQNLTGDLQWCDWGCSCPGHNWLSEVAW